MEKGDRGEIWSRGCGWRTKDVCGPYGVGMWKEIMKEADWCWESMDLKVGKGNRVLFWMDKWCGNEALSQTFPQLFTLAGHKNAKVCEVWDSSLGQGGWNLSLARDFNDWEIDQIGEMLNLLKDFRISQEEDSVRWKREGNGVFGAKGAYKSLSGYSIGAFPNRRIWMDKVPTKVSFFAWEAAWGKIFTLDKLQRRGWQFPNRCYLCGCEEENANHILLHCTVVKTIWEITLVISEFNGCSQSRNRIVFRGGSLDIQKFKNSFGSKKTLVLREIAEDGVRKLLSKRDSLAACDIALFVYDSSDESSWKRATELLVEVASHGENTSYEVPCLIVAAKDDLDPYPMAIHDSTRLTQDMGIEPPIPISAKLGDFNTIFRRIIAAAEHPHLSIPETEAGRSRKQYSRLINRSLMVVSVGAAVAIVGLAAYRVYAARKSTSS
ncbi:Mitochondrial Rho GTPase 1 [Vitis vinifera]|uniref:Mitochondrial Rho GTPase 1 n=1 Tax=Vitis vinifera TaxID=29760 RepID=A0A438F0L0_VITVI|nr:Mitochondrial Rho GTPase 1 [Vitis vinifera]